MLHVHCFNRLRKGCFSNMTFATQDCKDLHSFLFLSYLRRTLFFICLRVSVVAKTFQIINWVKQKHVKNVRKITSVLNVLSVQPTRTHWPSYAGAWSKLNPKCWQVLVSARLSAAIHPLGRCLPRAQCKCHVCQSHGSAEHTHIHIHTLHTPMHYLHQAQPSISMHLQSQGCKQEPANQWVKGIKSSWAGRLEHLRQVMRRSAPSTSGIWDQRRRSVFVVEGIQCLESARCFTLFALKCLQCWFYACFAFAQKKNQTFWLNTTAALCASQTIICMSTANN